MKSGIRRRSGVRSFPTATAPSTNGPGSRCGRRSGSSTGAGWSIPECRGQGSLLGVRLGMWELGIWNYQLGIPLFPLFTILQFPEPTSGVTLTVVVAVSLIVIVTALIGFIIWRRQSGNSRDGGGEGARIHLALFWESCATDADPTVFPQGRRTGVDTAWQPVSIRVDPALDPP